MIELSQLAKTGTVGKTHGFNGDVNIKFDVDIDLESVPFFVFEIDGILVPFFLNSFRFKNDMQALVLFDGIETEAEAREIYGKSVYINKDILAESKMEDEEEDSLASYLGYMLKDDKGNEIGQITDIDDSTDNVLFMVGELLIPVGAIEALSVDERAKTLCVSLPEGLLDL
jgi:16S rRNA processing protein RimM